MIRFNLSQDLAKDLANLPITPELHAPERAQNNNIYNDPQQDIYLSQPIEPDNEGAMIWYAHEVILAGQKCVIAMEYSSRYAMVFCGLRAADFNNFQMIFTQRLWREACVITQLDAPLPEEDIAIITGLALELSQQQNFYVQANHNVQEHIYKVKELLESWVLEEGYPLPIEDDDALHFDLVANEMLHKCQGGEDYFVPIDEYRNFWLGFVRHVQGIYAQDLPYTDENSLEEGFDLFEQNLKTSSDQTKQAEKSDKVIHVDFINKHRL